MSSMVFHKPKHYPFNLPCQQYLICVSSQYRNIFSPPVWAPLFNESTKKPHTFNILTHNQPITLNKYQYLRIYDTSSSILKATNKWAHIKAIAYFFPNHVALNLCARKCR